MGKRQSVLSGVHGLKGSSYSYNDLNSLGTEIGPVIVVCLEMISLERLHGEGVKAMFGAR